MVGKVIDGQFVKVIRGSNTHSVRIYPTEDERIEPEWTYRVRKPKLLTENEWETELKRFRGGKIEKFIQWLKEDRQAELE